MLTPIPAIHHERWTFEDTSRDSVRLRVRFDSGYITEITTTVEMSGRHIDGFEFVNDGAIAWLFLMDGEQSVACTMSLDPTQRVAAQGPVVVRA